MTLISDSVSFISRQISSADAHLVHNIVAILSLQIHLNFSIVLLSSKKYGCIPVGSTLANGWPTIFRTHMFSTLPTTPPSLAYVCHLGDKHSPIRFL